MAKRTTKERYGDNVGNCVHALSIHSFSLILHLF